VSWVQSFEDLMSLHKYSLWDTNRTFNQVQFRSEGVQGKINKRHSRNVRVSTRDWRSKPWKWERRRIEAHRNYEWQPALHRNLNVQHNTSGPFGTWVPDPVLDKYHPMRQYQVDTKLWMIGVNGGIRWSTSRICRELISLRPDGSVVGGCFNTSLSITAESETWTDAFWDAVGFVELSVWIREPLWDCSRVGGQPLCVSDVISGIGRVEGSCKVSRTWEGAGRWFGLPL
jgi:hypothetical protein